MNTLSFKDLDFKDHPSLPNHKQARFDFEDYFLEISVVTGPLFNSGHVDKYEVAVYHSGKFLDEAHMSHLSQDDVSKIMRSINDHGVVNPFVNYKSNLAKFLTACGWK